VVLKSPGIYTRRGWEETGRRNRDLFRELFFEMRKVLRNVIALCIMSKSGLYLPKSGKKEESQPARGKLGGKFSCTREELSLSVLDVFN